MKTKANQAMKFMVGAILVFLLIFSSSAIAAEPQSGDIIDSKNIDQYSDYFPEFMQKYIENGYDQLVAPAVIYIKKPADNLPPESYLEATRKNTGTVKLNADGSLSGYSSGYPFPQPDGPDKALKIAWNLYYRWRSDDFAYPGGFLQSTQRYKGSIIDTNFIIEQLSFTHRTILDPKPNLTNPRDIHYAMTLNSQTPPNKDMITLIWRYEDSLKSDDMWTYVPTLRRTIRLVSSERGNPVRGTPFTWDDFFGFDGKILEFDWTYVGEKKVLGLFNQQTLDDPANKKGFHHPVVCGESDPFELRTVHLVEAKSKDPRYPESKKVLYIGSDQFYYPIYVLSYDKVGNLWKGAYAAYARIKTAQEEEGPWSASSSMIDMKTRYWSQNLIADICVDCGLEPQRFMPGALGMY